MKHEQLLQKQQQFFFFKATHVVTRVDERAASGWNGVSVCLPSTVSLRQSLQFGSM